MNGRSALLKYIGFNCEKQNFNKIGNAKKRRQSVKLNRMEKHTANSEAYILFCRGGQIANFGKKSLKLI